MKSTLPLLALGLSLSALTAADNQPPSGFTALFNGKDQVGWQGAIDPRQAHGSAYGMVAAAHGYQHPVGEWNFQQVTVKGSTVKVELNGTVILDCDLGKVDMENVMAKSKHPGKDRTSGFFGFAGHADPVEFRNVRIKKL